MADAEQNKPLVGKKAVVTGGNKGIGESISLALAGKGADIAIVARDTESAQNVIKKVRSERRFCKIYPTDLSDAASVRKSAKDILADMGRVDILVNNAGMSQLESLLEFSEDNWDRTMNVNLKAPFILSQEFAKGMIERKSGKIIHISSVAAIHAVDEHAAYCVSKAGLSPTVVWTEMGQRVWGAPEKHEPMLERIPAHRFVKPEEVAELTVFLAGPGSDMICGQTIAVDGGLTTH
ncbi:L-xylulose reductase [Galdieria sulphuraria]|nr:L-xylulose reductase [Galdieria sulphuraria]